MKNYAALLIMVSLMTAVAPAVVELHLNFDTEEDGLSPALVGTDATLMGNATITTGGQGISGEALQLDGESFAQLMDYKGIGGNDARTVSLWVKTAVNQANGTFFIGWGDTGLGARVRYDLGLQSGTAGQLRNEFNAGAATSATGAPITDDVWHHIAVTYDGNRNVAFYLDGDPYGTTALTWDLATLLTEDVVIGTGIREATEWGALARWIEGLIDDVQIYNTALSQADIEWLYDHPGQVISPPRVINPTPTHGSDFVNPTDQMQWELFNVSDATYIIHIGTGSDCSDVLVGHSTGSQASYTPPSGLLNYGTTYCWRVDVAYEGHVYSGPVWSFSTGGKAIHPVPADGTIVSPEIHTISWTGDALVDSYNVYFGVGNNLELAGNYTTPVVGFADLADALDMELLPGNTTYQWRVDTLDAGRAVLVTGPIWTLTLQESYYYSLIEDFYTYADTAAMRQVWTAAGGAEAALDSLMHIMNLTYDCAEPPHTGQAAITFDVPQTWTQDGWKAIQINFRGRQDNRPAGLSIVLDDGANEAVVFHPDPDAVTRPHWQQWDIPLSDFIAQGIDSNHIVALSIGVGNGAAADAAGTVYLNEMRLYPRRCLPDGTVPGDINRDCRVDSADLLLLADYWLHSDYDVFAVEPLGDDLIARYLFDENFGDVAFDSSGNNHHATVVAVNPDTIWDEQGVEGACVRLEDTDSFILLPASVFADIGPSVTLSLWIEGQADDWPTEVDSVEFLTGPPPRQEHNWDQAEWMIDRAEVFGPNWNHYAFVKDGLVNTMQIFCNGLLVARNDAAFMPTNGSEAGQTRLSLSRRGAGPVKVDELRIYSQALTHAEVLYLAAGPSGRASQPLVPVFTEADLTGDGHIGLADLAHLARHWMAHVFWPR